MRSTWVAAVCLGLICVFFAASAAIAQGRYLEFPREGFRLEMPEKWVKVPEDVFRDKMRPLEKALEKSDSEQKLGYDYAVQLESKEWFEYPYMLISHWEDVRVDRDEMPGMNEKVEEGILKGGKGINGTELVRSSFDPERCFYRAEARFTVSGQDMVLLKGVYYLNQSVLQLSTYVPEETFSRYAPDIKQAMDSIQLDPGVVHHANPAKTLEFEDVLPYLKVSIGTVIVLIGVGVYFWIRRRDKRES